MAKKMITVSDISGDVINPGEGVKVHISFNDNGARYELDAHKHEVEGIINAAHRVTKRKYTKKQVDMLDAAAHS